MRIVTPALEIGQDQPFHKDSLMRKPFGDALLNLVLNCSDELVISLDGRWGEGKTTFVKMWQGMLTQAGVPNVYIDAFANDYADDAFIAVASSLTEYIENNTVHPEKDRGNEFREKAKNVGVKLLSWGTKVAIKAATLGAIRGSDLQELKDIQGTLAEDLSGVVGDLVDERLMSHARDVEVLQSFKLLLSDIPAQLSPEGDKPLVIIIDELDRCRPTYAVELIEKVKHLFAVKNVVFLLVMHKKQLEEAVKCVYGANIDSHTYLQKFINIEANLPKNTGLRGKSDISRYNNMLFEAHEFEERGDRNNLLGSLEALSVHFNLSLRQLERAYTNIAVFYLSSSAEEYRPILIVAGLAVIKVVDPSLYQDIWEKSVDYQEFFKRTRIPEYHPDCSSQTALHHVGSWFSYALMSTEEFESLPDDATAKSLDRTLWNHNLDRKMIVKGVIERISLFNVV